MQPIVAIIPARYASSRLPGKPLAKIAGKPMIRRVWEQVVQSKLVNRVIIATDHKDIVKVCKSFGAEVVLTSEKFATGSDRIAFVASTLADASIIVNVQGDEPFIPPVMIDKAVEPLLFDETVQISTLAKRITRGEDLLNPAVVKVVFDGYNNALYFSRSAIPFVRDASTPEEALAFGLHYRHVGLYVYRNPILQTFTKWQQSPIENLEKLEQLRILENGYPIKVVETELDSLAVDTPADLAAAEEFAQKNGM